MTDSSVPRIDLSDQDTERNQINQNIEAVLNFYAREDEKMSFAQRLLEKTSYFISEPIFLGLILLFVFIWIACNLIMSYFSMTPFDPAPFHFLQAIVGLSALLTATVVLSKQNRLAKLEERRAHLDLKVNLLTEQKTAKMIDLLEELRFDLPNIRNRPDTIATELKHALSPKQVLAALDERGDENETQDTGKDNLVVDIDGRKLI